MALLGGIEAGGTKFVCAVGTSAENILLEERFPTTEPAETIERALEFFRKASARFSSDFGPLEAIGVGAFGPLDLNPRSKTYGYITSTPKAGWQNVDLLGPFHEEFGVHLSIDTDVNAAALGEGRRGAGRGLDTFMYITVGTGFGGGLIINNQPVHGLLHPEVGHMLLDRLEGDDFAGNCPYHGHCVEGMCSGPAIAKRWGKPAQDLPADHEAWDVEAKYLARALMAYILIASPERIIMGGGVMHQRQLFPKIRSEVRHLLNDYVDHPAILEENNEYIVPPELEDLAGISGALILAENALMSYIN